MSDTVDSPKEEPLQELVPNPNVYLVYPDIINDDGYDRPNNSFSQH